MEAMDDVFDVECPCCGEYSTLSLASLTEAQEFVQDCPVCCRPWTVRIRLARGGHVEVSVNPEGE